MTAAKFRPLIFSLSGFALSNVANIFIFMIESNESKSIHLTFTTQRETCPPVHINNVQLPQEYYVKYLGLHLDRRLTWQKHISAKQKQLGITLTKMYWLLRQKSKLSTSNKLIIYTKQYSNHSAEYNSGVRLSLPTKTF
jgi:hypothetical protein